MLLIFFCSLICYDWFYLDCTQFNGHHLLCFHSRWSTDVIVFTQELHHHTHSKCKSDSSLFEWILHQKWWIEPWGGRERERARLRSTNWTEMSSNWSQFHFHFHLNIRTFYQLTMSSYWNIRISFYSPSKSSLRLTVLFIIAILKWRIIQWQLKQLHSDSFSVLFLFTLFFYFLPFTDFYHRILWKNRTKMVVEFSFGCYCWSWWWWLLVGWLFFDSCICVKAMKWRTNEQQWRLTAAFIFWFFCVQHTLSTALFS